MSERMKRWWFHWAVMLIAFIMNGVALIVVWEGSMIGGVVLYVTASILVMLDHLLWVNQTTEPEYKAHPYDYSVSQTMLRLKCASGVYVPFVKEGAPAYPHGYGSSTAFNKRLDTYLKYFYPEEWAA